jgi:hypothetical protein
MHGRHAQFNTPTMFHSIDSIKPKVLKAAAKASRFSNGFPCRYALCMGSG